MRTIRSQMMGLFVLLMAAMLALVFAWNGWERWRVNGLAEGAYRDKRQFVSRVVELKGSATANLDEDYTYWDDMIQFVRKPSKQWAVQNLDQALLTYKVTACWVFDRNGKIVYTARTDPAQTDIDVHLSPQELTSLFQSERRRHFFVQTPRGTLEIRAATIHATADPQRKGPWFGYFLVGKLWDADYLKEVSDITTSSASISSRGTTVAAGIQPDGAYVCALDLPGLRGEKISTARFKGTIRSIQVFRELTRAGMILVLASIVLVSAIVLINLRQRVSVPLARLSISLETGNTDSIGGLERNQTEFGEIARLISTYFQQRQNLVDEVAERMQAESALREAHSDLESRVRERTAELEAAYLALRSENEDRKQAEEDLSRAEAQLIQSAKLAALGTLCAGVAHELNQPVAVIRGLTQQLLADHADGGVRDDLKTIEGQTSRMMKIVNHLRTFSRATRGELQTVDLNQVAADCVVIVGQQLKAHDIAVEFSLHDEPVWVLGDANELEQVLLNLLTNARHAMEDRQGAAITIRTWVEAGHAMLEFRDNGPGIPDAAMSRLFDPFFTTKEPGKGTGLGLSISHTIIQKHRGTIRAYNENGAVFRIDIPEADPNAEALESAA